MNFESGPFGGLARGLLIAALLLCSCSQPVERPNIILVIGDDHGYRDFGFMGSETAITPRLDALAAGGTVFTHGYSTASNCQPSLRTLLTGLEPLQFSARAKQLSAPDSTGPEVRHLATLPRVLGAHGYTSFQSGKYWEGTFADAGFDEGMQTVAGIAGARQSNRILREGLDPVFDFIDRNREGPFFLWFAPKLPHIPHDPPSEFLRPYLDSDLPIDVVTYYGSVTWFDDGLGRLIDHLVRAGIREQTLIVYASDNGWEEVSRIDTGRGVPQLTMLGGPNGKMSLYDPGFRTPVIFDWPGRIPAGVEIDNLISLADLFPTILSFAGIEAVPDRDGRDLRALIEHSVPLAPKPVIGMMEGLRPDDRNGKLLARNRSGGYFYRDETWHYIEYLARPAELYRVIDDPEEAHNLAQQEPERVARFSAQIAAWDRRMHADVPPDAYVEPISGD